MILFLEPVNNSMIMLASPCPKKPPPVPYQWEIERNQIKLQVSIGEGL
jgi:hypothetical protein